MGENEISYKTIGAAIEIHKKYGSGLLENAYEKILAYELRLLGIDIKEQLNLPLIHKDLKIEMLTE